MITEPEFNRSEPLYVPVIAGVADTELESLEYHRDSETYRAEYDPDGVETSTAVVASLSAVLDCEPTELDPLHASIDTDALDAVLRVRSTTVGDVSVTFNVAGRAVTVHSYGVVAIGRPGRGRPDGTSVRRACE